jgi:hypothetical protein
MMDTSRPRSKQRNSSFSSASFDDRTTPYRRNIRSFALGKERRNYAWELTGLFCVLVLSRFSGLTHQSLWYDEGYTVALVSVANFHEFWLRFGNFTTSEHLQPLYYLLMYLWSRVAGVSDAALRIPSAFFSLGSSIAACSAVSSLAAGRRAVVLLASSALVVSSFSLYYAQEARPYALLQFLSFLLLAIFLRNRAALSTGSVSRGAQISFAVACALCLLGSPFTTLLVFCLAVADLWVTRGWKLWLRGWRVAVPVAVGAFLAYLIPALKTMPSFIARDVTAMKQPLWMNVVYAVYGVVFGTTLDPAPSLLRGPRKLPALLASWPVLASAALTLLVLAIASYLLFRNAKRLSPLITIPLFTLALYMALLFGIFGAVGHLNVLPRHASALFALLFAGVAGAGSLVCRSTSARLNAFFLAALGGWLILNCISVFGYFSDPALRKDDYRGAAAVLRGYPIPTFVVAGQPQLLARYGAVTRDATNADPDQLAKFIEANSGRADEVALVFNEFRNYRWASTSLSPAEVMAPDYTCRKVNYLANIDIYACWYLASKEETAQGAGDHPGLSRVHGVPSDGRTEVRSLGITSAL